MKKLLIITGVFLSSFTIFALWNKAIEAESKINQMNVKLCLAAGDLVYYQDYNGAEMILEYCVDTSKQYASPLPQSCWSVYKRLAQFKADEALKKAKEALAREDIERAWSEIDSSRGFKEFSTSFH